MAVEATNMLGQPHISGSLNVSRSAAEVGAESAANVSSDYENISMDIRDAETFHDAHQDL